MLCTVTLNEVGISIKGVLLGMGGGVGWGGEVGGGGGRVGNGVGGKGRVGKTTGALVWVMVAVLVGVSVASPSNNGNPMTTKITAHRNKAAVITPTITHLRGDFLVSWRDA